MKLDCAANPSTGLSSEATFLHSERSPQKTRRTLMHSRIALVEDLSTRDAPAKMGALDYSPNTQICFPYRGLFVWHVAGEDVVGDPNQILFVRPGEEFRVTQPRPEGFGEMIVTPTLSVLADLSIEPSRLERHTGFQRRTMCARSCVQHAVARFRRLTTENLMDGVTADELLLEVLRNALGQQNKTIRLSATSRRLVDRAKCFLGAHWQDALRLQDISAAIGASPAYLTDAFRRVEGVPLHAYLVQLRLARALTELPNVNDLTGLALQLGFSSHSHFTAAFRKAFGCTPSEYRASKPSFRSNPTPV